MGGGGAAADLWPGERVDIFGNHGNQRQLFSRARYLVLSSSFVGFVKYLFARIKWASWVTEVTADHRQLA